MPFEKQNNDLCNYFLVFLRRIVVRLVSQAGTGHFYTTSKNKQNPTLEFLKHDPVGKIELTLF